MAEPQYYQYYKVMSDSNVDLAFKGPFSHEILLSLAETLVESISRENDTVNIAKKVFAIFVELTQNIRFYSAEVMTFKDKKVGTGLIVLQEHEDHFTILSGNKIKNENAVKVSEYISRINNLDRDELKQLYKKKLSEKSDNENSGGVGFISIIRKSGNKLDIQMEQIDDEFSFFVVSTNIDKE
ncbi:MAG: hypothetical protein HW421_3583 [Ignavibacteria bacterium]|nr:hypothetical protein [Ignavibacteria bacterium]